MTNKERIIERLNKLKKMRENGEEGERTNAAALIEDIMRRHGISESDLDEEEEESFWLQVPDRLHFKLFLQTLGLAGKGAKLRFLPDVSWKHQCELRQLLKDEVPDNEEYNVIGYAKRSVFAEGLALYMMYKDDLSKNLDRFFYAYLHRNDLLIEPDEKRKLSDDEREDIMASLMMAQNIRRAEVLRQLKEGGANEQRTTNRPGEDPGAVAEDDGGRGRIAGCLHLETVGQNGVPRGHGVERNQNVPTLHPQGGQRGVPRGAVLPGVQNRREGRLLHGAELPDTSNEVTRRGRRQSVPLPPVTRKGQANNSMSNR